LYFKNDSNHFCDYGNLNREAPCSEFTISQCSTALRSVLSRGINTGIYNTAPNLCFSLLSGGGKVAEADIFHPKIATYGVHASMKIKALTLVNTIENS
jgi:hypothetical protein